MTTCTLHPPTDTEPLTLRPYQAEAVDAVYDHLRVQDDNPCIVIPTGGGKTPVMSTICHDAVTQWEGRVLVLAHVKELLEQTAKTIRRLAPDLDVGVYSAGLRRREQNNDVIVAGIQSVYQRACELSSEKAFDLVIIDEAHMIPLDGEGRYQTFLNEAKIINPHMRVVGLTATPYRTKDGLICQPDHFLNEICYEISVASLIEQDYLCDLKSKMARNSVDTSNLHVRGGEFIASEMEQLMDQNDVVSEAVAEMLRLTEDRKSVLVFCVGVSHAEHVAAEIRKSSDHRCATITGDTPPLERAAILERFKRGELKYLTNVNVLTTGFDAPNIDSVCLLRPTYSPGLYYQMVGRGFRLCEGKDHCLILDFAGNIERHGPVDAVNPADPSGGGVAPTKSCPNCQEVVSIAARHCSECSFVFPIHEEAETGSKLHDSQATTAAILSRDLPVSTTKEHDVCEVSYSIHTKRDAPEGHPKSLRVDYRVGFYQYHREWICVEHSGFAQQKALGWWRERSNDPMPTSAEKAVEMAEAGALAEPLQITICSKSNERYDQIASYTLGPIPPRMDGSDERDTPDMPDYEWAGDDIPF